MYMWLPTLVGTVHRTRVPRFGGPNLGLSFEIFVRKNVSNFVIDLIISKVLSSMYLKLKLGIISEILVDTSEVFGIFTICSLSVKSVQLFLVIKSGGWHIF